MAQGKVLGKLGGGNGDLKVYAQANEPDKKDGIWIKTTGTPTYTYNDVIIKDYLQETYDRLPNIPFTFKAGAVANVGKNIYIFDSNFGAATSNKAYKLNLLTNTYTQLSNTPAPMSKAVSIGTDIYVSASNSGSTIKKFYKYDTLTDTYTQLSDTPYSMTYSSGSMVAKDTDIYFIFSGSSMYKYDILTDTYTQLTDSPVGYGATAVIGDIIYIFSYSNNASKAYKYDILTDTYTQLTHPPYNMSTSAAGAIGSDIYILGNSNNTSAKNNYKYDTLTDTYTQLTDIPYQFEYGGIATITDYIYMFGSGYSSTDYTKYASIYAPDIAKQNNNIYISSVPLYKTKLLNNLSIYFGKAYIYDSNALQNYECYYGDGTSWNLIN